MARGIFGSAAAALSAFWLAAAGLRADDSPEAKPEASAGHPTPPLQRGEIEGAPTILHRDEVLNGRGQSGRHLWPLLSTPEARMNYFEVTGRGPLHFHPDADHRLYVLEGAVVVTCGATVTKCGPGDFIVIPRGVRHCYDVAAPGERALLLTFDAPPYDPRRTVSLEPKKSAPKAEEKGTSAVPNPASHP